jgi:hypothetical protein
MPDLDITASDAHVYDVTITHDDGRETRHCVQVPEPFLAAHGVAESQEPLLVRASLQFLLEHEPGGTIQPQLSLDDIAAQFTGRPDADYPDEVLRAI